MESYKIVLTKEEPDERLDELCEGASPLRYAFSYHKFQNGYFMKCVLNVGVYKVASVTHFVAEDDLVKAKKTVASKLLYSIGLSPLDFPNSSCQSETVDDMLQNVLDELPPQEEDGEEVDENSLLSTLSQHLTSDQLNQYSGLISSATSTFATLGSDGQQQAMNLLSRLMSSMPSSSSQIKTEQIDDLE